MSAPPSLNLLSELIVTISVVKTSLLFMVPLALITLLGGAYNLYLFSAQQGTPAQVPTTTSRVYLYTGAIVAMSYSTTLVAITLIWENSLKKTLNCDLRNAFFSQCT